MREITFKINAVNTFILLSVCFTLYSAINFIISKIDQYNQKNITEYIGDLFVYTSFYSFYTNTAIITSIIVLITILNKKSKFNFDLGGKEDFLNYQQKKFPFLNPNLSPVPKGVYSFLDKHLTADGIDKDALRKSLAGQLNNIIPLKEEKSYYKALVALFYTGSLDSNLYIESRDKLAQAAQDSQETFDQVAESIFNLKNAKITKGFEGAWNKIEQKHKFRETALMGVLNRTREKSTIPMADILWLKTMDRALFMALDSVNSTSFLPESVAFASHYLAERLLGRGISEPVVEPAIEGIVKYLNGNKVNEYE